MGAEALAYSTYTANFYCQLGTGYTQGWPAAVNGWNSFNGIIDEVTLYTNVLTSTQVSAIYIAAGGGKCLSATMPSITSASVASSGKFQLTASGVVGSQFRIWSSTDLRNWQVIATLTNATGTLQFTDGASTNFTSRYYEVTSP